MARPNIITKEEILSCTIAFVKKEGLNQLSIRNIADTCGVAPSTIYLYFENKMDLICSITGIYWEDCFNKLDFSGNNFFEDLRILYNHLSTYLKGYL